MARKKYEHGEWMGLYVDDDINFIKGHIDNDEAYKIALEALRNEQCDPELNIEVNSLIHHNARFGFGYDECGERVSWLYLHRPNGERGSFPVTEVRYALNCVKARL